MEGAHERQTRNKNWEQELGQRARYQETRIEGPGTGTRHQAPGDFQERSGLRNKNHAPRKRGLETGTKTRPREKGNAKRLGIELAQVTSLSQGSMRTHTWPREDQLFCLRSSQPLHVSTPL